MFAKYWIPHTWDDSFIVYFPLKSYNLRGSRTKVQVEKSLSKQIFCSNYFFVLINQYIIYWMINRLQFCLNCFLIKIFKFNLIQTFVLSCLKFQKKIVSPFICMINTFWMTRVRVTLETRELFFLLSPTIREGHP